MKLLFRGRWPPTDGPAPAPTPPAPATPAPNKDRFKYPPAGKAATGLSAAKRLAKMFEICAVVLSIKLVAAPPSMGPAFGLPAGVSLAVAVLFGSLLGSLFCVLKNPADD